MGSLYQEVILDLARNPRSKGLVPSADGQSHQINPTCGDDITLQLRLQPSSDRIAAVTWDGHGCAISQASASMLVDVATGLSTPELLGRIALFREAMRSRGAIAPDEALLGDAVALQGVSRYSARVKCAMLAWVAAEGAVADLAIA
ncbi:Fe-S cluster assembly sulfur transfer protein SufU [uncultured Amnibacterium sp.]|uniref:Fe-S cluster assembly sulfur transfer protein SufU n=1 Tax=uncultured Amnibacterium sp. TaxID=1631851 RepID=UPI0035CA6BA8